MYRHAFGLEPASPGFSIEAARMLVESRQVKGHRRRCDGDRCRPQCAELPVRQFWLCRNRWGIEGITNLESVPPVGALIVVGAAPVAEATEMPVHAIAFSERAIHQVLRNY